MKTLKDQRVLVVGGSSGIGLATAAAALAAGAHVTIASHDASKLKDAQSRLGEVEVYNVDTRDNDSIEAMFTQLGAFDHIVVSAAATKGGPVRELALEDAYSSMESKFWGAYRIARSAPIKEDGSLTLISGFLSRRPSPTSVLQGAINAALEALVRGLALEIAPIRVNAVSPGLIDTPLYAKLPEDKRNAMFEATKQRLPLRRIGAPEDIAQAALFLATNPFVTGTVITVDGGATIA
ncbi:SDR family oxidoreductase [Acidicapsa ligni]|uniref:SDR family oxidoreductase n=1 Tax=Acidicapsa ligni TaxID=542300 RepID=UPI0021E08D67|nr:SDR family oxidoreductase [Acidicapsa ligni]